MTKIVASTFPVLFLKAKISAYTRKDGTYVAEHQDKRSAASAEAKIGRADNGHENLESAKSLAEKIRAFGLEFEPNVEVARGGSAYVTVLRHTLKKDGSRAANKRGTPMNFKARFADHGSYWGSTISVDPISQNTVSHAFSLFKHAANPKKRPEIDEFHRSAIDPRTGEQRRFTVKFNENSFKNGGRDYWRDSPSEEGLSKSHIKGYTRKDGTFVAAHDDKRAAAKKDASEPKSKTQTPEFKRWFGDSKVVDADGKPLVVYHGTPGEGFAEFRASNGGIYFAEDPSVSEHYGTSRDGSYQGASRFYLSASNIFDADITKSLRGEDGPILFLKSNFKHQAGYALYGHPPRWHKVTADKPAPKGAPTAAHPAAAGHHEPAKHLTDEEWEKLKLDPSENTNAGTFNKQLEKLKHLSETGNVTGLLAAGYGVNTYGKKLAALANWLLGKHGSKHEVKAGQKAGEHTAVQSAPEEAPTKAEAPAAKGPEKAAPAPEPPKPEPEPEKPAVEKPKPKITPETLVAAGGSEWTHPTTGKTRVYFNGLATLYGLKYETYKTGNISSATLDGVSISNSEANKILSNELGSSFGKVWFDAADGKFHGKHISQSALEKIVGAIREKVAANDNDAAPEPTKPPAEPEKPAEAPPPEPAAPPPPAHGVDFAALLLPETNVNAKSVNKKVAALKAAADAGDVAALQAMNFGVNTYGKKLAAAHAKVLSALGASPAQPSLAQALDKKVVKVEAVAPSPAQEAMNAAASKQNANKAALLDAVHAAGFGAQDIPTKGLMLSKTKGGMAQMFATEKDAANAAGKLLDAGIDANVSGSEKPFFVKLHGLAPELKKPAQAADVPGKPKAPEPAPKATVKADAAVYHHTEDGHNKFWSVSHHGNVMKTVYGKIGSKGSTTEKTFGSESEAEVAKLKAVSAKKAKGYKHHDWTLHDYGTQQPDDGPKDGDTRQGKNGMQVLKDGHWQNVEAQVDAKKVVSVKEVKPAAAASGAPLDASGWPQVGPQGGSNPGGVFEAPDGTRYYCKFPADANHAHAEVLAARLYELAGIAAPKSQIITRSGKIGIAVPWDDALKHDQAGLQSGKVKAIKSGFAADAWLGNRDVVGEDFKNIMIGPGGVPVRIDVGASLMFRAQGQLKEFGPSVGEADTLLDPKFNAQTAAAFKGITKTDIAAGVAKIAAISDAQIAAAVNASSLGTPAEKAELAKRLSARRDDLVKRFPAAKKAKAKKKPFNPDKISEPPSFLNWGGSGKGGPSGKAFINESNHAAVQAIYQAAKTGDKKAVEGLELPVYDKDTGIQSGTAKALNHPSQHVKGYAQQALNEIEHQLNPPKRFRFDGSHPLAAINASFPSVIGEAAKLVKKVGKFLGLGDHGTIGLDHLGLPQKITHAEGGGTLSQMTYAKVAQAAYAKMPKTQRDAIMAYTGSGYKKMNHSLWDGNPIGAAKAAAEALHTLGHDIAPGTVLSRQLSLSGDALQQVLGATGKVLQEPAIMSTSIRPSSWNRNVQFKLHIGPGVKGLYAGPHSKPNGGAISVNSSEDEILLPPNTRLLVLSVKANDGKDQDGFGKHGQQHIVECVVLPTK